MAITDVQQNISAEFSPVMYLNCVIYEGHSGDFVSRQSPVCRRLQHLRSRRKTLLVGQLLLLLLGEQSVFKPSVVAAMCEIQITTQITLTTDEFLIYLFIFLNLTGILVDCYLAQNQSEGADFSSM